MKERDGPGSLPHVNDVRWIQSGHRRDRVQLTLPIYVTDTSKQYCLACLLLLCPGVQVADYHPQGIRFESQPDIFLSWYISHPLGTLPLRPTQP